MKPLALAVAVALPAATAFAQQIAPGLWEQSMTMKSQSGQMEAAMEQARKEMAKMPAEQRKMMEDMMAQRGVGLGPTANSMRLCITPEQAKARDFAPSADGRCTHGITSRSGSTVRYKVTCEGNPPTTGEGEFTMSGDKAYQGRMHMTMARPGGGMEAMDMQVNARWLGADCGSVKPLVPPRKP